MTVNISMNTLWIYLIRLLSLLGIALASIDPSSLPPAVRAWIIPASAIVLAVDRYITDPSSGNPVTPPGPAGKVTGVSPPAPPVP